MINRSTNHNRSEEVQMDNMPDSDSGLQTGSSPITPAVSVSNLRKVYGSGDQAVEALTGVSFEVEPETAVGILGPNGAGKTTVIKTILTLILPSDGSVRVCGMDVHDDTTSAQNRMGAMLEGARNTYWRLTVKENLEYFSVLGRKDYRSRRDRIHELLNQFNLREKADTVVRELSQGQKQKVSLACTIIQDADVLFLDEPTLGLDVESSLELRKELRSLVQNEDTTVLLSSHNMDVVEDVCDRVIIMNDGQIVADNSIDDLLELFNTTAYEVTVENDLLLESRQRLSTEFDVTNVKRQHGQTVISVNIVGNEIYHFMEILQSEGLSVKSIELLDINLEEVFLSVIGAEQTNDTRRLDGIESGVEIQ